MTIYCPFCLINVDSEGLHHQTSCLRKFMDAVCTTRDAAVLHHRREFLALQAEYTQMDLLLLIDVDLNRKRGQSKLALLRAAYEASHLVEILRATSFNSALRQCLVDFLFG